MALPYESAERFIRQMHKMPNYPGEWDPLEKQMILALAESARDEAHAQSMITRLMAAQRYAPMPCDIRELAVADADPTRQDQTPSPYTEPGYADGSLTDGMTLEDLRRWQALAERTKHKATRTVALGLIADFYRRHPHLAPPTNGDQL